MRRRRREQNPVHRQHAGCAMGCVALLVSSVAWLVPIVASGSVAGGLVAVAAVLLAVLLIAGRRPSAFQVQPGGLLLRYLGRSRLLRWEEIVAVSRERHVVRLLTASGGIVLDSRVENRDGLVHAIAGQVAGPPERRLEPAEIAALLGPDAAIDSRMVPRFHDTALGRLGRFAAGMLACVLLLWIPLFGPVALIGWLVEASMLRGARRIHRIRLAPDGLTIWPEFGRVDIGWSEVVSLVGSELTTTRGVFRVGVRTNEAARAVAALHQVLRASETGAALPRLGEVPEGAISRAGTDVGPALERGLSRDA